MNPRVIPLLALVFLATTTGLSNILPAHAVPLFTLANKNTTCFNGAGVPCTTPTVSPNLGIPNGAAPFFNITVTASAADSVNFAASSNATGPIVSFKDNPLVFSGAGAINETVTIAAPTTGSHGGYAVTITGTDSGGSASVIYQVKIYAIAVTIDSCNGGTAPTCPGSGTDTTVTIGPSSQTHTFYVSVLVA